MELDLDYDGITWLKKILMENFEFIEGTHNENVKKSLWILKIGMNPFLPCWTPKNGFLLQNAIQKWMASIQSYNEHFEYVCYFFYWTFAIYSSVISNKGTFHKEFIKLKQDYNKSSRTLFEFENGIQSDFY